jgi:hypothetical protein
MALLALEHGLQPWRVDENGLDLLARAGLIDPERYELLDGVLIEKRSQEYRHIIACEALALALRAISPDLG